MGSLSTQNALQQLYSMNMMLKMQPYMKGTVEQLGNFGDEVKNSFQGIPDWNRYIRKTYEDPINYQMNQQLKDLGHTKEFFSSGHHNRRAGVMNQANQMLSQSMGQEMMGQRQGQMTGMESGLNRQMQALAQIGRAHV